MLTGPDGQGREPGRVERPGLRSVDQPRAAAHRVAGDMQMLVDCLPRDEQVHDLRRALNDAIDAHVAEHLFGRDGLFASLGE